MALTRRGLLAAAMSMITRPSRRHGMAMEPVIDNVFFIVVVAGGTGSGVFVYSPSAGAGNLVASITGQAGTDPYGNAYKKGITSYGPGEAAIAELTGGELDLIGSVISNPASLNFGGGVSSSGLTVRSGTTSAGGDVASVIYMVPSSQNASGVACVLVGDANGVPADPATADQLQVIGSAAVTLSMFLKNRASDPATPTGGGRIYCKAGALFYKGSGGTVTQLAGA